MRRRPRKSRPAHDYTDAARGERLQKVLAAAGIASRRACEQLIEEGSVKVNGQVVRSLPAWVNPREDHIEVDGRPIARHRKAVGGVGKEGFVYVALHKPREVISTTSDDLGRLSVTDLVELPPLNAGEATPRLYPVGRLDAEATGLILLTNDGDLAHRLTHPSYEVPKEYEVSWKRISKN
jgi:16S rRNA U516 pseudouridylate synthase RsuA-like enzyme